MRMMQVAAQVPVLVCARLCAKPVAHIVSALESSVGLGLCPLTHFIVKESEAQSGYITHEKPQGQA